MAVHMSLENLIENSSTPLAQSYLATGVLFIKDNQVLLLHRISTGFHDQCYALVGGKCDEGESIVDNAIRESYEEVGAIIQPQDLQLVHVMHRSDQGKRNWVLFFFVVQTWENELINKEPLKHNDMRWFALDDLPKAMMPAHQKALEAWKANQNYSLFPI